MHRQLSAQDPPAFLLVGPYDPMGGEYTFLAPPLGVWRLAGVLSASGFHVQVFDPNCCEGRPESAFEVVLGTYNWDVVGFSTTGMTLRYDLALAHLAQRALPNALRVAGGMEATFSPEMLFQLGPIHLVVLGEGERPLLELGRRLRSGNSWCGIAGTVFPGADGRLIRLAQGALPREELRDAIFHTPYEDMPYSSYWRKLEQSYRINQLPVKADREARLAEIRSVRLITLNYCPMRCTFCASTNFLDVAQGGSTAKIARLEADEVLHMLRRIVTAHPDVRTIIFQDDIFVFTQDRRILPLCEAIVKEKSIGGLPHDLQFISTNRIDSMNDERLVAMRRAGFRVLGFGVESFALGILKEFNKEQIYPYIAPVLESALRLGITPFLDMILTSPRCTLEDLAENIRQAYRWVLAGCEVGIYPYVIPFSGAAMAADPTLRAHTTHTWQPIEGTDVGWEQPTKILPVDSSVRDAILAIEEDFERKMKQLIRLVPHLPSRLRSLLWVVSSIPTLTRAGCTMPALNAAVDMLLMRLPGLNLGTMGGLRSDFQNTAEKVRRRVTGCMRTEILIAPD
jgi:radical SAM superfamily enzyme YgiQ (UPF0313 family)